jgi:soluble lytic murein transglycosylase
MTATLRATFAALVLLAPSVQPSRMSGEQGTPAAGSLRATLRPALGAPTPAWLQRAVCQRGADLGPSCGAVADAVSEEAEAAGLDPVLVLAIIEVESGWDPDAVSDRAAHGLMQLQIPTLADEAADGQLASVDAHDPIVNVRAGVRYYARLLKRFSDPELAMVAYNAGPNRLARYIRSEVGVPERFWEYPRAIRRAERRLRARVAEPAQLVAATEGKVVVQ